MKSKMRKRATIQDIVSVQDHIRVGIDDIDDSDKAVLKISKELLENVSFVKGNVLTEYLDVGVLSESLSDINDYFMEYKARKDFSTTENKMYKRFVKIRESLREGWDKITESYFSLKELEKDLQKKEGKRNKISEEKDVKVIEISEGKEKSDDLNENDLEKEYEED